MPLLHSRRRTAVACVPVIVSMTALFAFAQSDSRTGTSSTPRSAEGSASSGPSTGSANRGPELPVGLQGYCPVCLVEMRQWIKGDAQLAIEYDGKKYYFPGGEQAEMFEKAPLKYVPVLGGDESGPQVGDTLGGPGSVSGVAEAMSEASAAYQVQVGGLASGFGYLLNGVKFDGFLANALIDAKGLGYAALLKNLNSELAASVGTKLLNQATRQIQAAGTTTVKWVVAESEFAQALRLLFKRNGVAISVIEQASAVP